MIDVLVVGAGPSGLSTAILLIKGGLRVRVIEKRRGISGHSRAIGIHPPGLEVLDAVGIGEQVAARAVRIRDGVGISNGRVVGRMDFSQVPSRHRYIASLPQNETLALLRHRLLVLDPRALQEDARYLGHRMAPDQHTVQVRLESGSPARSPETVCARWLIGADGATSAVRHGLRIPFAGRELPDRYVMGDYPDTTDFGDTAALFLHPEGIIESFPLPGGLRRWVARQGTGSAAGLATLVRERAGYLLDDSQLTMSGEFGTANRQVSSMVHRRTVLIGDAAHEVSPIGGQGMTLGLLDAAELAGILSTPPGVQQLLWPGFERRRLAASRRAGRQAHLNMVLGRPLPKWVVPARDLLLGSLAGSAGINSAVARTFTMTNGRRQ
ncbi:FAD-dependent monooxygenase [Glutamicibacter sp. MNS18]|uniref:FAD-dependent oxidoreductase n=1 Tax=Glutamicibacter sp. MNS18 TaxID=2989817 RepID=UPI00223644C9|nr:NAD(P)/FAD-dependent oxidoreductase [Glutamicibacter sp. MNS18]MCW4465497.1 FAD-dependent monooxygenase [Glutamicibacter sp. MNS18]